jgi:hypothetical protein
MSTTEYKGFTITERVTVASTITDPAQSRFYIDGDKFNPDGYSTLNNAKGAITKYCNAQDAKVTPGAPAKDTAVLNTILSKKSKEITAEEPKADVAAVTVPARVNRLAALLTYRGFKLNPSDTRSRNAREGAGHVKRGGKYVRSPYSDKLSPEPRTRKQRKAAIYGDTSPRYYLWK